MNLFLISSPFQLLSAISAKDKFKSNFDTIVVRYSSSNKNNAQLKRLLYLGQWDKIIEIQKSSLNIFRFLWVIRNFSKLKTNFKNIFIGDFRVPENLVAIANISCTNSFLLDDGGVTITVQNVFFKNLEKFSLDYLSKFKLVRKLLYRSMGLKMFNLNTMNLFTCFDLAAHPKQKIVFNDFIYLRSQLNQDFESSNDRIVYFLGTSMVENGFISLEYYYKMMNRISKYYENLKLHILYIPHRIESIEKLNTLKNKNLELLKFDNPVELEFIYRKIRPVNVASFFSTALYTLKLIHGDINIDAFLLNNNEVNIKHREHVSACYSFNTKFVNEINA